MNPANNPTATYDNIETCPASTLKQARLYIPYKGRSLRHGANRAAILATLEATGTLSISAPELRSTMLADSEGDALDSVVAALTAFRAHRNPAGLAVVGNAAYALEGYVYVGP